MKIMFTHDHKFYKDEAGVYYSDGQYPYRLWQRYLEVFDEIVVACRVRKLPTGATVNRLDVSSGPGVSFIEIPSISSPLSMLFGKKKAAKQLERALQDCDGLIARISEISRLAARIADKLKKPWLAEVVYCPFDALWNHGTWQGKIYAPYAFFSTRQMIAKAPYALYVTQNFLQHRYPCAGETISCSDVQLQKQDPAVLTQRLLRIEHRNKPVRIGMIGALSNRIKGIQTALQALSRLQGHIEGFEFYVLGGGDAEPWKHMAEKYKIADKTFFCGTLSNGAAVYRWLDQIDIYIQPSFQEGLPRALLEAMSRGCPAIASTAGGIPELLDRECLHDPGDSQALARLLEKALENSEWQNKWAVKNFSVAAKYDPLGLDEIRRRFWRRFSEKITTSK